MSADLLQPVLHEDAQLLCVGELLDQGLLLRGYSRNHATGSQMIHSESCTSRGALFPSRVVAIPTDTQRWWEKARRQASILLHLNPESPGAYQILGDIALGLGEDQHAIELYEKGLKIDPLHRGLLNNFGVLRTLRGNRKVARQLWDSAWDSPAAAWNLRALEK